MATISGIIGVAVASATTFAGSATSMRLQAFLTARSSSGLDGSTKNMLLRSSLVARSSAAMSGSTKNVRLRLPASAKSASSMAAGVDRPLTFSPLEATSASTMVGTVEFRSKAKLTASATAVMVGTSRIDVLDVPRVISESLSLWGYIQVCTAPPFAIQRALNDLNQAVQLLWASAQERSYWTRATVSVTFGAEESSKDLESAIQSVIGPCRRADNKRPLAVVGSIGELETFSDLYLDGELPEEPIAYHIGRTKHTGTDPAKCTLHIHPAPSESFEVSLDVVREAPRYNASDVKIGTPLSIPHKYVETVLLPIVRYHASTFYLFQANDQKPTIDREYQQARATLGMVDPLPGKSGDNKEEVRK